MKIVSLKTGRAVSLPSPERFLINWDKPSLSKLQFATKSFLRPFWQMDVVFEEFPIPRTRMSLDIVNWSKRIAIEVQGQQHLRYIKHFHGHNRVKFLDQIKRDQSKQNFCDEYGIKLVEIYPDDVLCRELFLKFEVDL